MHSIYQKHAPIFLIVMQLHTLLQVIIDMSRNNVRIMVSKHGQPMQPRLVNWALKITLQPVAVHSHTHVQSPLLGVMYVYVHRKNVNAEHQN